MPYESMVLGTKWNVRLQDMTGADALRVTCPKCAKVWHVATHLLYLRFEPYTRIISMESEMKCKSCDRKGDLYWEIVRARCPSHLDEDATG
jgi:C4-type Zn-finger protein